MDKKYEILEETKTVNRHTLHQIRALCDIGNVKKDKMTKTDEEE